MTIRGITTSRESGRSVTPESTLERNILEKIGFNMESTLGDLILWLQRSTAQESSWFPSYCILPLSCKSIEQFVYYGNNLLQDTILHSYGCAILMQTLWSKQVHTTPPRDKQEL
ncbi:hypothetical protein KCU59_g25, partial [Aureobasidium melanogenum]